MRVSRSRPPVCGVAFVLLAALFAASPARAQHAGHAGMSLPHDSVGDTHVMVQAIGVVTRAAPAPGGGTRTEAALTQALLQARARRWRDRLAVDATLDAEGLIMPNGELSLGAFGEGYVDRRHPHTYLHELVIAGLAHAGPAALSVAAGRGFVSFGTDDPMVRPFVKYPINHHLAQILERGLISGAARLGPAVLELSTFSGEEPQRPSSLPLMRRFGDSWSARATVSAVTRTELQASYARVASPEVPNGFGLDQRKQSISARFSSPDRRRYALAEWARTVERDHSRRLDAFAYESALVEGATQAGPIRMALRLEQTDRPEEERLADQFRTARPATDLHILGLTRWRSATLNASAPAVTGSVLSGVLFVELARLEAEPRDVLTLFDPGAFYGGQKFWMVTLGVRLRAGAEHDRMGRYGVARDS